MDMKWFPIIVFALVCFSTNLNAQTPDKEFLNGNESKLYYEKGQFYLGDYKISETGLKNLLPIDLYQQASEGLQKRKKGKRLIVAGSILAGIGTIGYITSGVLAYEDLYVGSLTLLSSMPVYLSGVACLGVGIPFYCIGGSNIDKACEKYNNSSFAKEVTFSFGTTRNGTGIFINF